MIASDNNSIEKKKLAYKNIRLAILLGLLAFSIYGGYILVYYFYR